MNDNFPKLITHTRTPSNPKYKKEKKKTQGTKDQFLEASDKKENLKAVREK